MPIVLLSPLLVGSFCQVSGVKEIARTQLLEEKAFINKKQNKRTKTTPYGKNKLAGWTGQDKAGQDTDDI